MSATRSASSCTYTFSDGRRCRTLRQSGHPLFCSFHARRHDRANAAETLGREFAHFFSGRYLSACDLNAALGRLFAATVRGHVPAKTTRSLAYLAQVMVQCIHLTGHEFSGTFGGDGWRSAVRTSVNSNSDFLSPAPPVARTSVCAPTAATSSTALSQPPPAPCSQRNVHRSSSAGFTPASSPSSPPAPQVPPPVPAITPPPAPTISVKSGLQPVSSPASTRPSCSAGLPAAAGFTPASSPNAPAPQPNAFPEDQPKPDSVVASLKSQLKHLLLSELSEPVARGAAPSQLAPEDPNHPARAEEVEVEKEFNEEENEFDEEEEDEGEMDEDSDDDFSGRYRNPAMRRRSWRERV